MSPRSSESPEHKQIKERMALFLREISGSHITEYPDSGHESDVFSSTYKGITIMVEIIWSLQKAHVYSDFLILSNSFANIKLLVVNHDFLDEKNKVRYKDLKRDYEKIRISEIRKGYIISEAFDSNLVMNNEMEEIRDFLDYSTILLSSDNRQNEKHLMDIKNDIVKPIISYLDNNSVIIERIPQIGNEELFYDFLKHFNLESQWRTIKDSPKRIISFTEKVESEFRNFCGQNNIPVIDQIILSPLYDNGVFIGSVYPDKVLAVPVKGFVRRLINIMHIKPVESILENRLTIDKYTTENIIRFKMYEGEPGNISVMYQGGNETQQIYNHLKDFVINHRNSTYIYGSKEIEQKLADSINKFKQSVERTL